MSPTLTPNGFIIPHPPHSSSEDEEDPTMRGRPSSVVGGEGHRVLNYNRQQKKRSSSSGGISVKFLVGLHHAALPPSMKGVTPELSTIHLQVVENLKLNSTWVEVMREECGVEMDPEEYQVHKRHKPKHTVDSARKHDLRETTSVLMNTFAHGPRSSERPYIIYINRKGQNGSLLAPGVPPAAAVPRGSLSSSPMKKNQPGTTNWVKSNNKPMPLSKKMAAAATVEQQSRQVKNSEQGRSSGSRLQLARPQSQPSSARSIPKPLSALKNVSTSARAVPPQLPTTTTTVRKRGREEYQNDLDTRSNYSDDSQLDDLEERGVRVDENLKAKVYEKVSRKYNNACLLRAKKDMMELKGRQNSTRWARLNTELPTVMAIFQDLLN